MSFTSRLAAAAARGYGMFRLAAGAAVDPFFNYVTALLHGDGTNGAQNNTFLDSSTNNFTITRNGNTTQGTFSPFSQTGWSAYFDGNGDYINFTNQGTTGSFTCECWFYRGENVGGYNIIFGGSNASSSNPNNVQLYVDNSGNVGFVLNGAAVIAATGLAVTRNAWNHIAWVRSGTSCAIFVNGLRIGTGTSSAALNVDRIGTAGALGPGTYDALGYISNARITTTAVYDVAQTTCTVPTTPLTAISGTYLLTLQSNRFVDNSASPLTLTVNGNTSVQAFSPFNPTSAWSASSNGGSGYFDGSGDYLLGPVNSTPLSFGTGDFTIESWVYPTSFTNANSTIFAAFGASTGAYLLYLPSSGYPNFYVYLSGGLNGNVFSNPSSRLALNAWSHVAVTRSSGVFRLFINGVVIDSFTNTIANINAATSNNSSVGAYFQSGMSLETTSPITGYIADVRVVKGTAVYTAAFTPPTAPLTAITNTSLLLNYTNAGIYDNAAVADYETLGNAQVSTSVKKYGTGSMAFDGTGDYLSGPTNANFAFGTGDFTVEGWVYFNSVSGVPTIYSSGTYNTSQFTLRVSSSKFQFYGGNGATLLVSGSTTLTTGVWYHFAVCRIAGVTKLFVNGNTDVTDSTAFTYSPTGSFSVGETIGNTGQLNGYIDDLRITKGKGRYQYNFTPPTAAFPNIGGTVTLTADPYYNYTTLLLPGNGTNGAQNNTFLDSSSNAFTITRNGNTTQGNFSPFSQTGWGNYFNGSASYLNIPDNTAFVFGTGDFTVEAWIYYTGTNTYKAIVSHVISVSNSGWAFQIYNNKLTWGEWFSSPILGTVTLSANTWYHVAASRSGTTLRTFVNGTLDGTATVSTNYTANTNGLSVGSQRTVDTTADFEGYISNVRMVKGGALYTANFTPSTTPLTTTVSAGTVSLLTCQSNRFLDNSANAFAITTSGSPSVQAFSPFAPTAAWSASTNGGSGYFDGSGDYLITTSTQVVPTGSFTVEALVYPTSSSDSYAVAQGTTGNAGRFSLGITTSLWYVQIGAAQVNAGSVVLNQWTHLAATFNGTTLTLYVNGTSVGTAATTTNAQNTTLRIGSLGPADWGAFYWTGYIGQVRVSNTVRTISVPTAPYSSDGNTTFLASYTNGGIVDATAKNDLETVGNAQISTTQSKFGGSSMYFDGAGDYLVSRITPNVVFGSGDMTFECWIYPNTISGIDTIYDTRTSGSFGSESFLVQLNAGIVQVWAGSYSASVPLVASTSAVTVSTWTFIAFSRFAGVNRLFVNGIQVDSNSNSWTQTIVSTNPYYIGQTVGVDRPFDGYIDDLRITKGIARYTSNFTPPTSAFLLQ